MQVSKKKMYHIPTRDMMIISGDQNAKIGGKAESTVIGKFGQWVRNEAGDWLVDFCEANNVTITNTCFKQLTIGHVGIAREPIQESNRLCDWSQEMEKLATQIVNIKYEHKTEEELQRIVVPTQNIDSIPDGFKVHTVKFK